VPTNAALKNAGHDGVTIGALEGVFATGAKNMLIIGAGRIMGGSLNAGRLVRN
jgi:hypothetical protein